MPFHKATKDQAKLRLALAGVAKAGKTYTALTIAKYLVPGGRTALIDTEHGSAAKYADIFDFDTLELDNFKPDNYIMGIDEAALAGYDVIIVDSLSHAWAGKGGLLEFKDRLTDADARHDGFRAWGKVTPIHNNLIEAITGCPTHIICTLRLKQDYAYDTVTKPDGGTKQEVKRLGLAPVQREGIEYEFDVLCRLEQTRVLKVTDTRCPALLDYECYHAGKELAETSKRPARHTVSRARIDWLTSWCPSTCPTRRCCRPLSRPPGSTTTTRSSTTRSATPSSSWRSPNEAK